MGARTRMRVKLFRSICVLMLLSIPVSASCDEAQMMTVEQLVDKCTTAECAAFCMGLATGVLSQLQGNGAFFQAVRLSDETRKVLKFAGIACGVIEPKLALMAFVDWAKIHPESRR